MILCFKTIVLIFVAAWSLQIASLAQTAATAPPNNAKQAQPNDLAALDVPKLIEDAARNVSLADKQVLLDYSWTATTTVRYYDKKNRLKETDEETAQTYPRLGQQAELVLSKNGKQTSAEDIAKAEKRLSKELVADEEKRQKYAATLDNIDYGIGIEVGDNEIVVSFKSLFETQNFTNPRRVLLNNRPTILLDFAQKTAAENLEAKIKFLAFVSGQVWIDETERQPARLEAKLTPATVQQAATENGRKNTDNAAAINFAVDSPVIVLEKTRLAENVWAFKSHRIYTLPAPHVFDDLRIDFTGESRDFKRFSATADEYKPQETKP